MGEAKSPMEVNVLAWEEKLNPWTRCADCDESFRLGDLEDDICGSCWKKRDQIESMEDR